MSSTDSKYEAFTYLYRADVEEYLVLVKETDGAVKFKCSPNLYAEDGIFMCEVAKKRLLDLVTPPLPSDGDGEG